MLNSDILEFEIANTLKENKRSKVRSYLDLCSEHVASTEDLSPMGKGEIGRAPWFTPDGGHLGFENYDENQVMQIWMKPVLEPYEDQPVSQISFGSVVSQHVKFSPDGLTAVWAQGPQIYAADLPSP